MGKVDAMSEKDARTAATPELEITPEMIEAGLVELRAFALDPCENNDVNAVIAIVKAALAKSGRPVKLGNIARGSHASC